MIARWFAVSLVASAMAAAPLISDAQPDPHLAALDIHRLMGTWVCTGADDRRRALSATLTWAFNDGGAFYFTLDPKPQTSTHPAISETWEWDAADGVWRAIPDSGTTEHVQFVTTGWVAKRLLWTRMAAQSTLDRAFVRTRSNRLTFRSERAILAANDGPLHTHILYQLACKRTVNDAPR